MNKVSKDPIIGIGVTIDRKTGKDKAFFIQFLSGKIIRTSGKLAAETCALIRALQLQALNNLDKVYKKGKNENKSHY